MWEGITSLLGQIFESPHSGISPEIERDVLKLQFNEEDPAEISRIFMTTVSALMGHNETPEELGVSLSDVWRPGHLSETAHDYIADCPANDLILAREILWEGLRLARKLAPIAHMFGASRPASVLFVVAFTLAKQSLANRRSIDDVLSQIYQIRTAVHRADGFRFDQRVSSKA